MKQSYRYKIYKSRKTKRLQNHIELASQVYNHCIALHKKYYKLHKKHLAKNLLQKHLTKIIDRKYRKRNKYEKWRAINSQVIQEITERIDKGYKRFFHDIKRKAKRTSPPSFKNRKKYKSITYKQSGYKYLGRNILELQGKKYKFSHSRPVEGKIKTATLKRDTVGDYWIIFSVEKEQEIQPTTSSKIVGFDFGLAKNSPFLTASDQTDIQSPKLLQKHRKQLQKASKNLSQKKLGSNNRHRARKNIARLHIQIADKRNDWLFKLANTLCKNYKLISLEDLNLQSMSKRWGRQVADLGFSKFCRILEHIKQKHRTTVHFCNRYFASSKICSFCSNYNGNLSLSEREWKCQGCNTLLHRERNASWNIIRAGASAHGLGDIRPHLEAVSA